MSMLRTGKQKY